LITYWTQIEGPTQHVIRGVPSSPNIRDRGPIRYALLFTGLEKEVKPKGAGTESGDDATDIGNGIVDDGKHIYVPEGGIGKQTLLLGSNHKLPNLP
jgi:hypothetical protein